MSLALLDELLLRHQGLVESMQDSSVSANERAACANLANGLAVEINMLLEEGAAPVPFVSGSTGNLPRDGLRQPYLSDLFPPEVLDRPCDAALPESSAYNTQAMPEVKPAKAKRMRAGDIVFWLLFGAAFFATVIFGLGVGSTGHRNLFGYAFFEVLTPSMQSVYPVGSLVLTRAVEPEALEIGDDITYLVGGEQTYTHRIVDIFPGYHEGRHGFQTQGVENPAPDAEIVVATNIVGKVIWHVPFFGQTLAWVKANWWLCAIVVGGLIVAAVALKLLLKKEDELGLGLEQKEEVSA